MSQKRRSFPLFLAALGLLVFSFLRIPMIHARSSSSSATTTATSHAVSSLQTPTSKQPSQSHHVLIYETEVLDDSTREWTGALPSRWTSHAGQESPPPINIEAPPNHTWEGEWKIIMSTETDALGWQRMNDSKRRRTWLRSTIPVEQKEETTTTVSTPSRPISRLPFFSIFSFLKEDWNFKGFGWSFYKSLLFWESIGVSFRIPLSQNLDWCERHQLFPSFSSSIGVYYPPTVAVFFSISGNVDYIKWCFTKIQQQCKVLCRRVAVGVLKSLLLILSLPLMMLSRQTNSDDFKWQQWLSSIPSTSSSQQASLQSPLNVDISERVGMSVSWRISRKRGYEFRVSYWHSYLPTILYLNSLLKLAPKQKLPMEYWLRRKTGSVGLSTSGPTPDPPHFSCSACVSLSGFHYSSIHSQRNIEQEGNIVLNNSSSDRKERVEKIKSTRKVMGKQVEGDEVEQRSASGIKHVAS